jgi:hypothetical protein
MSWEDVFRVELHFGLNVAGKADMWGASVSLPRRAAPGRNRSTRPLYLLAREGDFVEWSEQVPITCW